MADTKQSGPSPGSDPSAASSRQDRSEALRRRRENLSARGREAMERRLKGAGQAPASATYRDAMPIMAAWQPKPALEYAWDELVRAARRPADEVPAGADLEAYLRELGALNDLAIVSISTLLVRAGLFAAVGQRLESAEVARRLGALPRFERLVTRWLKTLCHLGLLRDEGGAFAAGGPLLDAALAAVGSAWPKVAAEVEPTCERVMAVITGQRHGLENFSMRLRGADTGKGFFEEAVQAYEGHVYSRYLNDIVVAAVRALDATSAMGATSAPLRILEVGAGVGGTTASVLEGLREGQREGQRGRGAEYVFTDLSTGFLMFAEERFKDHPSVSYACLSVDDVPTSIGFPAERFDVIIGGNSLHCARRALDSLRNLGALLVDRGLLILREGNVNSPYLLISQGLQTGASDYEDSRLDDDLGPLLPASQWQSLCHAAGFSHVAVFPEPTQPMSGLDESIVIAAYRRPEHPEQPENRDSR